LYDNWNKSPEERRALLEEYDNSHSFYNYYRPSSLTWE
jgi:hypothetical protein